jgi:hypothetical protein
VVTDYSGVLVEKVISMGKWGFPYWQFRAVIYKKSAFINISAFFFGWILARG